MHVMDAATALLYEMCNFAQIAAQSTDFKLKKQWLMELTAGSRKCCGPALGWTCITAWNAVSPPWWLARSAGGTASLSQAIKRFLVGHFCFPRFFKILKSPNHAPRHSRRLANQAAGRWSQSVQSNPSTTYLSEIHVLVFISDPLFRVSTNERTCSCPPCWSTAPIPFWFDLRNACLRCCVLYMRKPIWFLLHARVSLSLDISKMMILTLMDV